jgi:NADPH-dependent curcumin reductase CurA
MDMSEATGLRIALAARPEGKPDHTHFRIEPIEIPAIGEGEVLLRILYLSLDPYMRGRMSAAKSYAPPTEIDATMGGGTVAEVMASNDPEFKPGDIVLSFSGWQTHAVAKADQLTKLNPDVAPVSTALGVLGMPGFTAYSGLLTIGQPKAGETVAVAAATGPVGSAVGQIARIKGARAVGIAGGAEKCGYLIETLGFDAAIDHRDPEFAAKLRQACPNGIDVYFENVGGAVWEAVLPLLNTYARVPLCGVIAQYNATALPPGPDRTPLLMRTILTKSLTIRGFINSEFESQRPAFLTDMSGWMRQGKLRYREDIVEGLENAPEAFIGMLEGKNFGKLLIKVS